MLQHKLLVVRHPAVTYGASKHAVPAELTTFCEDPQWPTGLDQQLTQPCCFAAVHVVAAQDPVGSYSECGPGRTYRIQCYVSSSGYLTDVVYRNTVPPTDIAVCNAPQQQLQESVMTQLEISASDSFIRMHVFEDDWGVRGIAMDTQLGERLQCGSTAGERTVYSSRSTYPLGGFTGSCAANGAPALPRGPQGRANQNQGHGSGHSTMTSKQQRGRMHAGQQADSSTRVTRVFGACWNTQSTPQAAGEQGCSLR
jgi:hypothetical protein